MKCENCGKYSGGATLCNECQKEALKKPKPKKKPKAESPRAAALAVIRASTAAECGTLDEVVFKKALAKAQRWMRKAYGHADLQEWIGETGGSISLYYYETLKEPTGRVTFNRGRV